MIMRYNACNLTFPWPFHVLAVCGLLCGLYIWVFDTPGHRLGRDMTHLEAVTHCVGDDGTRSIDMEFIQCIDDHAPRGMKWVPIRPRRPSTVLTIQRLKRRE